MTFVLSAAHTKTIRNLVQASLISLQRNDPKNAHANLVAALETLINAEEEYLTESLSVSEEVSNLSDRLSGSHSNPNIEIVPNDRD